MHIRSQACLCMTLRSLEIRIRRQQSMLWQLLEAGRLRRRLICPRPPLSLRDGGSGPDEAVRRLCSRLSRCEMGGLGLKRLCLWLRASLVVVKRFLSGREAQNCRHSFGLSFRVTKASTVAGIGGFWSRSAQLSSLLDLRLVFALQKCHLSKG